jgi:hypothetical protein
MRTTAELQAAGLSAGRIRRMVRDGTLVRLRSGIYAPMATVTSLRAPRDQTTRQAGEQLLAVAAALAVTGPGVAGSHRSAARIYGLGLVGSDLGPATEVTRPPGERAGHANRSGVLVLESLSRAVFHQAGLPPPDLQVWIGDDGEVIGRVDFLWRRYNTIGEADGAFKYQAPARARTQLERDALFRTAGYEVVHFTWPQITRAPAQVVDEIQVAFRRATR